MNRQSSIRLIAFVVLILLVAGGYFLVSRYRSGKTVQNPGSQSAYNTAGWQTFADELNAVEFKYPSEFTLQKGDVAPTISWRVDADPAVQGIELATVRIPRDFEVGTNFGDATFHVGVSNAPKAVIGCLKSDFGRNQATSSATVNGNVFTTFEGSDAAAGNRYDTEAYRLVLNGRCYAVDLTVHSTVIENYPPEFGIKPFDRTKVIDLLSAMLGTLKIGKSDVPPVRGAEPGTGGLVSKQKIVSDFLKTNISKLSPQKAVLGGTFYVTDVQLTSADGGTVAYEDGHIALKASFNYSIGDNQQVSITNFKVLPDSPSKGQVCAQVITRAKNLATGEVREFPTPCDVPQGWVTIAPMPN